MIDLMSRNSRESLSTSSDDVAGTIELILTIARCNLKMDVAFVSRFDGDQKCFEHVSTSKEADGLLKSGSVVSINAGFCQKVVSGQLPQVIPDTSKLPESIEVPVLRNKPIRSHLSVPLILSDGYVYGTFCCFSFENSTALDERDLNMVKAFAVIVAHHLGPKIFEVQDRAQKRSHIEAALTKGEPSIVFQPVYELNRHRLVGAEALARFKSKPLRSPDKWFNEAAELGKGLELELQAVANAIREFRSVQETKDLHLAVNASPQTIVDREFVNAIKGASPDRLIIEITEHHHVDDYDKLIQILSPLRALGIKVAVDDAGAGYASMRHIINLHPDYIKLDVGLTRNIHNDGSRRALAKAFIAFANESESQIIAEGVETSKDIETLRALGAHAAQGFKLGKPMPIADLAKLTQARLPRPRGIGLRSPSKL